MFVGGMKDDTTDDQIKDVFAEYGNIEKIDVVKDKATGKVRGFAFIEFDDYDAVDKAVCKYHSYHTSRFQSKFSLTSEFLEVASPLSLPSKISLFMHILSI